VIVNAILNTRYKEATDKGIVFVLKVNNLSNVKICEKDIVLILSNLLNNAIEVCERAKEKVIKLKFMLEEEQIIISVKIAWRQCQWWKMAGFKRQKPKNRRSMAWESGM